MNSSDKPEQNVSPVKKDKHEIALEISQTKDEKTGDGKEKKNGETEEEKKKETNKDKKKEKGKDDNKNKEKNNEEEKPKRKFWFFKEKPQVARDIKLDGTVNPPIKAKNVIKNQKYNVVTFVPIVLFEQFKYFFNLFFLANALSQFVPVLKIGYLITFVGPLVLVLALTMAKEAYDDWQRYRKDKQANSAEYKIIRPDGTDEMVPSSDLKVGDIIEITAHQRIPADLILVWTPDEDESVFIKTDQLDGETDWKLRKPISFTQKSAGEDGSLKDIQDAVIKANPPSEKIYEFEGVFECQDQGQEYKEALTLDNTMWASTVLAMGKARAIVAYTGKDMRVIMNSRDPRSKKGKLDLEINFLSKLLFILLTSLSVMLVAVQGFEGNWYVQLVRFIILLSSIIPISLRVNLDFAKIYYAYLMAHDKDIEGCVARNRDIPEELGRIQYLLADKTGTLTQNEMLVKRIVLENGNTYTPEKKEEVIKHLEKICGKEKGSSSNNIDEKDHEADQGRGRRDSHSHHKKTKKKDKDSLLRDMFLALALCHNVTPVTEDGKRVLQSSSPDEIALVQIAEDFNMKFQDKNRKGMKFENAAGEEENYEILATFPFSSDTKRMGIVLKNSETNKIVFYLKGADTVMRDLIPETQKAFLDDESESIGREGLRTLVITQKYLSEEEFTEWNTKYEEACQSLEDRDEKIQECQQSLEVDLEFLGLTGIEDKLQDGVSSTIESLKNAGIQVWMLTGDKIETATCIAITAGIKSSTNELFTIKEMDEPEKVKEQLEEFSKMHDTVLIIDGTTLTIALEECYDQFFDAASKAPAVVCCRCSPTQKATLTEGIKKKTNKVICSIGDGGNDVGMIQASDVGIGIEGKEGKQAALASDFSILKFSDLNKLVLWHGRLSYKRSGSLANFVIHRGLIISFIQTFFSIIFYGLSIPVYNGYLLLGYSTVFTMFPVFSIILDEDIDLQRALNYPPLYKTLQKGRELNARVFLTWVWRSIYQGGVIMFLSLALFDNSFFNIVTITFTSLIVLEMLNTTTALHHIHWISVVSIIASIIVYLLVIIFFKDEINTSEITLKFLYKVISLTIISWLPLQMVQILIERFRPTEEQKLMRGTNLPENQLRSITMSIPFM